MIREWNSEAYNRLSQPQLSWGKRVIERVRRASSDTDARVLDAGCGTGRVTAELISVLPQVSVVGVDLSHNQLKSARGNLSQYLGRVSLVCADASALPLADAVCDGVFSTAAFHWVRDHPRLFEELVRVLKPGGWLVAQCGGGPNLAQLRERVRSIQNSEPFSLFFNGWREPWEFADDATTALRLRDAGFSQIKTWLENADLDLQDATNYREYLATVTLHQHLAQIPDEQLKGRFLDELSAQAAREGRFRMDYWRLNIDARKPV